MEVSLKKIARALLSVSDKTGIVEFATKLADHGIELVSTGGTAAVLRGSGLEVRDISDLTGFPEMLDGRVKTLHPRVHGGLLGMRDNVDHRETMAEHKIEPIDMVVVNLYPFQQTILKPGVSLDEAIENIDIGGPAMIRSGSKNHRDVAVVVDPADYGWVIEILDASHGALPLEIRFKLAQRAFQHTAAYDAEISQYLADQMPLAESNFLPERMNLGLDKVTDLRYGENPHQQAALYRLGSEGGGIANAEQLQGKELSYNNLLDSDAAWELVLEIHRLHQADAGTAEVSHPSDLPVTCAIIKHTNPCGVGIASTASAAFLNGKATDPVSAFGGIIAFSGTVDETAASEIADMFAEVIIAPNFTSEALVVLGARKNLRLLRMPIESKPRHSVELRRISGGLLVQEKDLLLFDEEKSAVVSDRKPTQSELRGLRLGWAICKHVKSNAIVYAAENQLIGVGAGQMSRIDSVRIGAMKAQLHLPGCVLASDAFFPFRDGLDEAASKGITAVIQPGGSVRDNEVIQAANEHGLAMIFTGIRHFKH